MYQNHDFLLKIAITVAHIIPFISVNCNMIWAYTISMIRIILENKNNIDNNDKIYDFFTKVF